MGSSEKFCLRWNDFESNISVAFREIRDEKDFFDVTLACGDRQIQAHKLILSACSPFFRGVLRRNPHAHPLLYLKGVDYSDLQAVLNFMYHGEVNVAQEELNSFLAVAEDLKVKGLTQNNQNSNSGSDNTAPRDMPKPKTDSTPRPRPGRDISDRDRDPSPGPAPKRSRPSPAPHQPPPVHTPVLPSYASNDDDDIQEVVPIVKSEPPSTVAVEAPPPPSHTPGYGPGTVAHNMDDSYGDDGYDYSGYDEAAGGEYDGAMMEPGDGNKGFHYVKTGGDPLQDEFSVKNTEGSTGTSTESFAPYIETNVNDLGFTGYQCGICGKDFHGNKSHCKRHIKMVHAVQQSIKCQVCEKSYKNKETVRAHERAAHGLYKNTTTNFENKNV